MNKELKMWARAFLFALAFDAVFVGSYWLFYYCPALYDGFLRCFGGSGEMSPPVVMWWKAASVLLWGTLIARGVIRWFELDAVLVRLGKRGKFVYEGQELVGKAVYGDPDKGTLIVKVDGDEFDSDYIIKAENFTVEEVSDEG